MSEASDAGGRGGGSQILFFSSYSSNSLSSGSTKMLVLNFGEFTIIECVWEFSLIDYVGATHMFLVNSP